MDQTIQEVSKDEDHREGHGDLSDKEMVWGKEQEVLDSDMEMISSQTSDVTHTAKILDTDPDFNINSSKWAKLFRVLFTLHKEQTLTTLYFLTHKLDLYRS